MNRGSALKWITALQETDWEYEPSQLCFVVEDKTYGSAHGVLANFLDPNGWDEAWDEVTRTWHGMQFVLDAKTMKRVKMKNDPYTEIDFGGNRGQASFYDVEVSMSSHKEMATFIEHHYELL